MANRCGAQPSATEQNQPLGFKLDLSRFRFTAELLNRYKLKGLILAQNERWRRGLGMQVVREVSCLQETDSGERESDAWVPALGTGIAAGNCR